MLVQYIYVLVLVRNQVELYSRYYTFKERPSVFRACLVRAAHELTGDNLLVLNSLGSSVHPFALFVLLIFSVCVRPVWHGIVWSVRFM